MLRIKFLAKSHQTESLSYWTRFIPRNRDLLGQCQFLFDPDENSYDWLVVFDDLPSKGTGGVPKGRELLRCNSENTLLITAEPVTIKVYGDSFLTQFGHVLSSQEPFGLRHRHHIHSQCSLPWFYGKPYNENLLSFPQPSSNKILSTVCSSKQQKHTLHSLRYSFTQQLKNRYPEMDIFGHGHRFIHNKYEALDPYYYHLAVENHLAPNHWTEKLSDSFLGGCYPFYFGAPNVFDYFPQESLCLIDIRSAEVAIEIIIKGIRDNYYHKALSAIHEARRRVLEEYALFPMLSRLIPELHQESTSKKNGEEILSRHQWRREHWMGSVSYWLSSLLRKRKGHLETRRCPI
jgi:hypothetical protein